MSCACGSRWLVEACNLSSGQVRAIWHPQTFDWKTNLNKPGQGSVTMATLDLTSRDIWPGITSVYISRIVGEGASRATPVCEFAGYVDQVQASDSNTTQIGLVELPEYLNHRTIKEPVLFEETSQTVVGRDLVRLAEFNGIPLFAEAATSRYSRDREFQPWNRKIIGEAIEQLTQVINGPDWEVIHTRSGGHWASTMVFRDRVGVDRELALRSDRELSAYAMTVDAKDLATWVDAIGSGEEEDMLLTTSIDHRGVYPQFDAAPAWKDITRLSTLQSQGDGFLAISREPDARPTLSISGMTPDPSLTKLGDTVVIELNFGTITYRGRVRIIASSWKVSPESADTRTLEVVPLEPASQTILAQTPRGELCVDCDT